MTSQETLERDLTTIKEVADEYRTLTPQEMLALEVSKMEAQDLYDARAEAQAALVDAQRILDLINERLGEMGMR